MKRSIILIACALFFAGGLFAQYYIPAWKAAGVNPYRAHNVYVYGASINGIEHDPTDWPVNWEIGVFDESGTLCGSIDIINPDTGTITIRCSTEGGNVVGSAAIGDLLMFRLWDGTTEYIYPEMAVQFYEPPTAGPTPGSVLYFANSATSHITMIQYETPEGQDTVEITPNATVYFASNIEFPNTGVTLVEGLIVGQNGVTNDMSVYAFDENSTDTYYNAADPADGTVPVENFSSYGWVIDPGDIIFTADSTTPVVITFDLSDYGPSISYPNDLVLYHRTIHGTSYFYEVGNYVYDPLTQTITVYVEDASLLGGEYIIGSLNEEDPLPVELSSFTALMSNTNSAVNLTWITQSEENMIGYRIMRGNSDALAQAEDQNTLISATNTSQTVTYIFSDAEIEPEQTYYYWLEALDLDGTNIFYGPIAITTPGQGAFTPVIPLVTGISSLYPNPFNPELTISYTVNSKLPVRIDIVNVRGQIIRTLVNENKETGVYRLNWNGTDADGRHCSSGIYFVRMQAGSEEFFAKAILMK